MTPLQSFMVRSQDFSNYLSDGLMDADERVLFPVEQIAAVVEKLNAQHYALETAKREVSESIKKLERTYDELTAESLALAPRRERTLKTHKSMKPEYNTENTAGSDRQGRLVSPSLSRQTILKHIGDSLHLVAQWSETPAWCEKVAKYYHHAEALIEVLETADCGSVGGFDNGQPRPRTLFDRLDWLYRKYDDPTGKRFGCNIRSYEGIRNFFRANAIGEARRDGTPPQQ